MIWVMSRMQKVIDVSYHNGTIDWERVKATGYHAIIRCGFGSDFRDQDDAQFKRNADECVRLGIPFGAYLYSYAKGAAQAMSEADHAIRLCDPYRDHMAYPLFFDTEEPGTEDVSKTHATIFCSRVSAAGFVPGIYASQAWWLENLPDVDGYVKWVARWSESEPIVHGWQLWQYSERGNVPGIKGNVDLNYSRYEIGSHGIAPSVDDLAHEVIAGKYGNGEERERKLGARASVVQLIVNRGLTGKWTGIDRVAREVIAGKWGNGAVRRENLGSAYDVVQKRVNELMKHK